jgi:heme-degrading monooxygenase HmoA
MAHLFVHHKVEDYKKWKPVFDEHGAYRSKNGSKGGKVFCSSSDPNDVFVLLEWDSLVNLKKFVESDQTKEAMQNAGVIGMPEIYFVDEIAETSE